MPARRFLLAAAPVLLAAVSFACTPSPSSPLSPTGVGPATAANADGSTLKVSAPAIVSPRGGERLATRRPELVFTHATGRFGAVVPLYRIEAFDAAGALLDSRLVSQGGGAQTVWAADSDLPFDATFAWRVRAELDGQGGPWSALESFTTPPAPAPVAGPSAAVGQPRSIGISEAYDIMLRIHDDLRVDLGSRSSREDRVNFWMAAVAAVHYGHPRFNPRGPDAGWCIKDAGGGRPVSDDVIVDCGSRDFWDFIGGVGANGYFWRINYDGRLPGNQNVYPPPRSALGYLGR
ncbi:MAG: hypothetical protein IT181_25055 [Acidobacteria bacterium]|nr:hypothetical protein [Acidobacteriota bacterium]